MKEIISQVAKQIGKPFIQGILALGFCIVLWIKFLQSDVSIPIEVFTGFVGLIVGFFFRDATK
jgi:hypothetical protein